MSFDGLMRREDELAMDGGGGDWLGGSGWEWKWS